MPAVPTKCPANWQPIGPFFRNGKCYLPVGGTFLRVVASLEGLALGAGPFFGRHRGGDRGYEVGYSRLQAADAERRSDPAALAGFRGSNAIVRATKL